MEALLEADADAEAITDVGDSQVEISAAQDQYDVIKNALEGAGIAIERSDLTKLPENQSEVTDVDVAQKVQKFLDMLDEHDDVTGVHTNFAPTAAVLAEL